jgi:proteasome lid subunit RPN8/RPN11
MSQPGDHSLPFPGFDLMTSTRLHVQPAEEQTPASRPIPLIGSLRWLACGEEARFRPTLPVFLAQPAIIRLDEHAASNTGSEVGGILVGDWCFDAGIQQHFVVIETALPARFTRQGSAFLTFTQDSLVDFHSLLDEHFPGRQILGWYHTHPGLGVFLSTHDQWLHQHFFPEAWQVAMVIDPLDLAAGFFSRRADGSLDPDHCLGFYELDGSSGHSYARWENLHAAQESGGAKGAQLHE